MKKKTRIHNEFYSKISQTTNEHKYLMTDINKSSSLDKVQKYITNLKQNPMPTKRNPFAGKNNPLTPSPKKKPTLNDTFSKDNYVSLPTIASSTTTGISCYC